MSCGVPDSERKRRRTDWAVPSVVRHEATDVVVDVPRSVTATEKRFANKQLNKRLQAIVDEEKTNTERRESAKATAKARRAEYDKTRKPSVGAKARKATYDHLRRHVCRHCGEEGHLNPIAKTSCPLYCTYCLNIGHPHANCPVQRSDAMNNEASNADAKAYKVIGLMCHRRSGGDSDLRNSCVLHSRRRWMRRRGLIAVAFATANTG
jgi:hypothetical protein